MNIHPISYPQKGVAGDTGNWRTLRPVLNHAQCNNCFLCWIYCPEAVIDKATLEIDYTYCKGCGVCAEECPAHAITMEQEVSA